MNSNILATCNMCNKSCFPKVCHKRNCLSPALPIPSTMHPPVPPTAQEVVVKHQGVRYRFPSRVILEKVAFVKDIMVLLLMQFGLIKSSNSKRVPSVQNPRQLYMVQGLPLCMPVVNVAKDMRSQFAAVLKVGPQPVHAYDHPYCSQPITSPVVILWIGWQVQAGDIFATSPTPHPHPPTHPCLKCIVFA